jgi:hypothetical protein
MLKSCVLNVEKESCGEVGEVGIISERMFTYSSFLLITSTP